jgi:hypothetical protein
MLIDLKGDEPVDQVFLAYLDTHRRHFAREIYRHNRKHFPEADTLHGAARLTEAVQRLMDRLVFMRVCEDRGIGEWGALTEPQPSGSGFSCCFEDRHASAEAYIDTMRPRVAGDVHATVD